MSTDLTKGPRLFLDSSAATFKKNRVFHNEIANALLDFGDHVDPVRIAG